MPSPIAPSAPSTPVANLSLQFEGGLADRVAQAAAAGFTAVEFWRWEDVDLAATRAACLQHGVTVEAFVTDWTVTAADPAERPRFLAAVAGALDAADVLASPRVVVTLGASVEGQSAQERLDRLAGALADAADLASGRGVQLLIEPVNDVVDHPGSALTTTADALELLERVERPELALLFDVYHSAAQGEDVVAEMRRAAPRIAYIQVADAPGRHEPGTGAITWSTVVSAIRDIRYSGPIGFEFSPSVEGTANMASVREAWAAATAHSETPTP